ncbi:MAG: PQQ-binding-like beta-propeller repeat protein [Planctomycetaceae bacterium]
MKWSHNLCQTVLLLIAIPSGGLMASDWPQWLGPMRNGVSSETIKPWSEFPEAAWIRETANGFSVPVVADGMLFVHAAVPDKDEEEVIAVDAKTGKDLWHDFYSRAPYSSQLGNGPRATPSVVDGRLFTTGITGVISCYEASTGKRQWQMNPWEDLKVPRPGFGVCASPVVVRGKLIVAVGGEGVSIVAYDTETGKESWRALDEPAGAASPVIFNNGNGAEMRTEVVVQTTLRLVGLSPEDGTILWEHPLVFEPSGVSPTSLIVGNQLICSTQDTGTLSLQLPAVGTTNVPVLQWWKQDLSSYFSTGSVGSEDLAYIVTNQVMPLPRADVRCVNIKSGEQKWVRENLGYFHLGIIRLSDGKLLTLNDAGTVTLFEPGEKELVELARGKACGGTFSNPILSNGYLYVRDGKGVSCFNLNAAE